MRFKYGELDEATLTIGCKESAGAARTARLVE
jgi:hypothetical protein